MHVHSLPHSTASVHGPADQALHFSVPAILANIVPLPPQSHDVFYDSVQVLVVLARVRPQALSKFISVTASPQTIAFSRPPNVATLRAATHKSSSNVPPLFHCLLKNVDVPPTK